MPQVELNDGRTNYYNVDPNEQFWQMYYYSVLLITGNDIIPQTSFEVLFCSLGLIVGTFTVEFITGSIAAEMEQ